MTFEEQFLKSGYFAGVVKLSVSGSIYPEQIGLPSIYPSNNKKKLSTLVQKNVTTFHV